MVIVVLLIFGLMVATQAGFYSCLPCRGEECNESPGECKYGRVRDACGRLACAMGPGERCGGRDSRKCGDGMSCKCGRCHGCSIEVIMTGVVECTKNTPTCFEMYHANSDFKLV